MKTIGETIKALRVRKQISQLDLANQLGVSRQTVSNWETGKTVPSLDYMTIMAEEYGLSLDSLFLEKEASDPSTARGSRVSRPFIYGLGLLASFSLLVLSQSSQSAIVFIGFLAFVVYLMFDVSIFLYQKVKQWQKSRKQP